MDVSFQGVKNVSYFGFNSNPFTFLSHAKSVLQQRGELLESYDVKMDRIMLQLNNKGAKDLSNFKKKYSNLLENNSLTFDIVSLNVPKDDIQDEVLKKALSKDEDTKKLFFFNANSVELKDETLSLFSTMGNLLKKISKNKTKLSISNEYKNTPEFYENSVNYVSRYPTPLPNGGNQSFIGTLLTDSDNTKIMAKEMDEKLINSVMNFVA